MKILSYCRPGSSLTMYSLLNNDLMYYVKYYKSCLFLVIIFEFDYASLLINHFITCHLLSNAIECKKSNYTASYSIMYVCGFALRYSKKINAPSLES